MLIHKNNSKLDEMIKKNMPGNLNYNIFLQHLTLWFLLDVECDF